MRQINPLKKSKDELQEIIQKIQAPTNVGIDAPLTHAIIIDYLQQLTQQIERIEEKLQN